MFLLENLEQFFIKNPITDFRIPVNRGALYNAATVSRKREDIANALLILMSAQGEVPDLPVLSFNDFDEDVRLIEASSSNHNEALDNNRSGELNNNSDGLNNNRNEVIANGAVPIPTSEE